jgi:predicted Fe-Mo cluster-binding NifX family protein
MKKKIAIPTSNGQLDPHFGHCRQFTLVEVEDDLIQGTTILEAPPHKPGLLPPWLVERDVTDVIAGGMGNRAIQLFNQFGINVFVGAPILSPPELVTGLIEKTITFAANYCDH